MFNTDFVRFNSFFCLLNVGLAGIGSDPPTLILQPSSQNSPGGDKSPSAGMKE